MDHIARRQFLLRSGAIAAAGFAAHELLPRALADPPAAPPSADPLPAATLGATGRTIPRLGLGCYPLGALARDEDAAAVLDAALAQGVRYFDTAPSYSNGRSERRVGAALKRWLAEPHAAGTPPRTRADLYIATKTLDRTADGARREVEASLERLDLDFIDCLQVHEVHDDYESLFGEGRVVRGLEKARDDGLIRHIGITGHRNPKYLIESINRFPFVSALVPINPLEVQHLSFVREFLPYAAEHNVGVIAMKVFAGGHLVTSGTLQAADCIRYALAQKGVTIAVPGCDKAEHVETDAAAARELAASPPSAEWLAELEARAGKHRGKSSEWYKEDGK